MIGQLLGGGQTQQSSGSAKTWAKDEREFTEEDFMDNDVTVTGNGFEQVGEYVVGADQKMEFGMGDKSLHPMEQGRPYLIFKNSDDEQVHGTVRFLHVSAQEGQVHKIRDINTRSLDESTPSERAVFERASKPSQPNAGKPSAGQDDKLRIKINVSNLGDLTTNDITVSNTTISQPVTVWERN